MVIVDERGGSAGKEGAHKRLMSLRGRGVDCDLGHLDFGDYAFIGNGPGGRDVPVGIELKTTRDIINSLRSNRLMGHQVPGLAKMYEDGRVWLVTEGIWRESKDGSFECYLGSWQNFSAGSRPIRMTDIESWILSTLQLGGMSYWHCPLQSDTARFVERLHHWWVDKMYDEHRSHEVIYRPPPDRAMFTEPTTFLKMVASIDKVGWQRAMEIEKVCGGRERPDGEKWVRLNNMTARELQDIPGIGPGITELIWKTLHSVPMVR